MADHPIPLKLKDLNLRGWKFFVLWIVSLSLSTFLTSAINSTMASHEKQKENTAHAIKQLKGEIRNLIYTDENLYLFCKENRSKKGFDTKKLEQINNERNENLRALVNDATSLFDERKISEPSYKAIARLAEWNQQLFLAGSKVCERKLKAPDELALWKKDILKVINENK